MRRRVRVGVQGVGLAAIAVVVLLASGCGYGSVATSGTPVNLDNGAKLFTTTCGGCHTLQAAGTQGKVGPDLDNAFAAAKIQHFADTSIENVVLDQIRLGSGPIATYTNPEHGVTGLTSQPMMPANLLRGQDAIDVAAYVASAVSDNYVQQVNLATLTSGAQIFKLGPCAGCHTLKAAGSHGTVGPNLDGIKDLTEAIVSHQVTNGGGGMPAFKGTLTPQQIQAVSQYVASVAGK